MPERQSLWRDDKGVIMITMTFFSFAWIGLVWFILGIATAVNYHENLQSAADASAFAAAVYDARGMNMIAMINVIMGVVLSILIIAHFIQIGIFIGLSADCLSCIPDIYCGYGWFSCPGDCGTMDEVDNVISDVDSAVHTILEIAHYLEVGIAVAWPWIAAGKSTTLVPSTPEVPMAASFAFSQIPWSLDSEVGALTGNLLNFNGRPSNSTIDNWGDPPRFGLPVTDEKYSNLCAVAFQDVTSLEGIVPGGIPGKIAQVLNVAGNWFCDASADPGWPTTVIEVASDVLLPCLVYGFGSPLPSLNGDIQDTADHDNNSPMKMMDTKMGTDYFGIWSTSVGNYKDAITSKRVQIAGQQAKRGNKLVAPLPKDMVMEVTRAEFYYDSKGSPGNPTDGVPNCETKICFDGVPLENVMWNMRWRARLRRYHNFPGLLGDVQSLTAALNNAESIGAVGLAETAITELINGGSVEGLMPQTVNVDSESNRPAPGIYH